ncbi:metallophosphoesterase, partial [Helicobacter sp. MIT 14-3879]|uniref:metallophosphoesterase n=1 Tax=Helicobacter sp. MIT 14-3879 TaxID=2040649 RepID=UPI000E39E6F0
MRYLLLTRGMPFCGKTSWIKQYNLESYALDSKVFNRLLQSPKLSIEGESYFYQYHKLCFNMLFEALESRMANGEFVIVEDLHISKSYFSNYKELANKYRYKILVVDFSDVNLDEILMRNEAARQGQNLEYQVYTQETLYSLYQEMQDSIIPIPCEIIKPNDIATLLHTEPYNLNGYKAIYHIGDIQGCFWVLEKYLGTLKDDCFYIFLGDYIDRGFQNYEVLKFLFGLMNKKNVRLLEGNHEKWLWHWANNEEVHAREFRFNTQVELEEKGFLKHEARKLIKNLTPYFYYRFHDKFVLCTHGGLSNIPQSLNLLSASECIYGVGNYTDTAAVTHAFSANTQANYYQVFGHRNKENFPLDVSERNYLLEGKVEFGGFLRTLELNQQGFHDTSIRNTLFVSQEEKQQKDNLQKSWDFIRRSHYIQSLSQESYLACVFQAKHTKDIQKVCCAFNPCVINTQTWSILARGIEVAKHFPSSYLQNTLLVKQQDKEQNSHKENSGHNDVWQSHRVSYPLRVYTIRTGESCTLSYYNGRFYFVKVGQTLSVTEKIPQEIRLSESSKDTLCTLLKEFKTHSFSLNLIEHYRGIDLLDCPYPTQPFTLINVFANSLESKEASLESLSQIANLLDIEIKKPHCVCESQNDLHNLWQKINARNLMNESSVYKDYVSNTPAIKLLDSMNLDSQQSQYLHYFSTLIKQQPYLFGNLFAIDANDNSYELDSLINREYR